MSARLVIKERAIEKIAVAAALQVPGVVKHRGGFGRLSGRDLPRAEVSVGDNSVAVNLYINIEWPATIPDITTAVHDDVAATLVRLTDMPLHKLNVLVAAVSPGPARQAAEDGSVAIAPRPPAASPAALPFALVIAIALGALAFGAVREMLIDNASISGAPWGRNTAEWVSRQHWNTAMLPAAVIAALLGLVLIVVAVKPRTKTHTAVVGGGTVWMRPRDIARVCSLHVRRVRGVESAHTTVTRRAIRVVVQSIETGLPTETAVRDALAPVLQLVAGDRSLAIDIVAP